MVVLQALAEGAAAVAVDRVLLRVLQDLAAVWVFWELVLTVQQEHQMVVVVEEVQMVLLVQPMLLLQVVAVIMEAAVEVALIVQAQVE